MSAVHLINLPTPSKPEQKRTLTPPIGLWSIRTFLEDRGVNCKVTDMDIEGYTFSMLRPEIFGLSARFSVQHDEYAAMARLIQKRALRVVAGGFHAAAVEAPEGVDVVCGDGSGEAFFAGLLGLPKPRGLNDVPFPRFSDAEMAPYWTAGKPHDLRSLRSRWMPIETSRGCPRRCRFCGVNRFWGGWDPRSAEHVGGHLRYLEAMNIDEVFIEDDNFSRDPDRFRRIVEDMAHLGIWWSAPNGIPVRDVEASMGLLDGSTCWRLSLPCGAANGRPVRTSSSSWPWWAGLWPRSWCCPECNP